MVQRVVLFLLVVAMACAASNNKYSSTSDKSWDLPANAKLEIHVTNADVHVNPGKEPKVAVHVLARSSVRNFVVHSSFEMRGSTGVLRITQPPRGGDVTVEVTVPSGTDLTLRGSAGDIDVNLPGGSKDIETSAGDVMLTIGNSKQYSTIDASTRAGDITAPECAKVTQKSDNSLQCEGEGKDLIRVHTKAGDVTLREGGNGSSMARE